MSQESDTISAPTDWLRLAILAAAALRGAAAFTTRQQDILPAMGETVQPFLAVAAIIVLGGLADRVGAFRLLARLLIPERASPRLAFAGVLVITAIITGITNLDVAVVVAMPVALRVASTRRMSAGSLAIAVALTSNATSFLLPTSNVTTLLLLSRAPLAVATYIGDGWAAWALVTVVTVTALTLVLGRDSGPQTETSVPHAAWLPAIGDLAPMFVIASAIRALLGAGITLHGGFWTQAAVGSLLAAVLNNLPAAAALQAAGSTGRWASICAMAIGPNLFLTGSVATLICRRMARANRATFSVRTFSLVGASLLPLQLVAAFAGLHATGAL